MSELLFHYRYKQNMLLEILNIEFKQKIVVQRLNKVFKTEQLKQPTRKYKVNNCGYCCLYFFHLISNNIKLNYLLPNKILPIKQNNDILIHSKWIAFPVDIKNNNILPLTDDKLNLTLKTTDIQEASSICVSKTNKKLFLLEVEPIFIKRPKYFNQYIINYVNTNDFKSCKYTNDMFGFIYCPTAKSNKKMHYIPIIIHNRKNITFIELQNSRKYVQIYIYIYTLYVYIYIRIQFQPCIM